MDFGNDGHYFNHWQTVRMSTISVTFQPLTLTGINHSRDTVLHLGTTVSLCYTTLFGDPLEANTSRALLGALGLSLRVFSAYSFPRCWCSLDYIPYIVLCCSNYSSFCHQELFKLAPFCPLSSNIVPLNMLFFICFRIIILCFLNHS